MPDAVWAVVATTQIVGRLDAAVAALLAIDLDVCVLSTTPALYARLGDPDLVIEVNCSMRDMGTHLCALPTGEHCPKGLVCLGCNHAQPKKSAAPTFRRMLASHTRALTRAHEIGEPAGQIAA